jgi:hypothetical protein
LAASCCEGEAPEANGSGRSCEPPAVKFIPFSRRCLCWPSPPLASFSPSLLSLRQG